MAGNRKGCLLSHVQKKNIQPCIVIRMSNIGENEPFRNSQFIIILSFLCFKCKKNI